MGDETTAEQQTIRALIGGNVARLRAEAGAVRQDDLARVAREFGFSWNRSNVAALERGDRAVPIEVLVSLPLILASALGRPVALKELFEGDPGQYVDLQMRRGNMDLGFIQRLVDGAAVDGSEEPSVRHGSGQLVAAAAGTVHASAQVHGPTVRTDDKWAPSDVVIRAFRTSGDAEIRMAQRLGRDRRDVVFAAANLWGHSLTAERDARVAEADRSLGEQRQEGRGRRAQVTRALEREVSDWLAENWEPAEPGADVSESTEH
ncbi:hypothetical protein [Cryptosporangium phraense]|uniref:Uncharacterized protein n=1 Tax=Cryptosporangium phraense TaxID=2593070 RepID=A0A545ASY5_9ACTN|nr:hypothetical protein [Cryptosporangium phraense]TQS44361.1 hypothetical protein FL583_15625 [Cryptosporangium phraense]